MRLQYCCRHLSLLPSFYETQSIHVECKQNVVLFLILCYSFKFQEKKIHASSICKRFLFPESNDHPKVTRQENTRSPLILQKGECQEIPV